MRHHTVALEFGCAVGLVAAAGCAPVEAVLAGRAADVVCFESPDLTANNASGPSTGATTSEDNSLPGLPMGCSLNPASTTFHRFYTSDPDKPWTEWTEYIIKAARLAGDSAKAQYGRDPRRTNAVGWSNGGYHAEVESTGKIKRPLVTVAGTMDALLPAERHARVYAAKVAASRQGGDDHRHAQYRLGEIQNGNHVDSLKLSFPQLQRINAQHAFDLLVKHVETGGVLPRASAYGGSPERGEVCGARCPGSQLPQRRSYA
jgi:hypothetical protein